MVFAVVACTFAVDTSKNVDKDESKPTDNNVFAILHVKFTLLILPFSIINGTLPVYYGLLKPAYVNVPAFTDNM